MKLTPRFNRLELAGAMGDLGTLLPMAIGMILINGLSPVGLFLAVGLFYILSGLYFGVTVPVQPMKVIGAYALATALTPAEIQASGLLIGIFMLIIGISGAVTWIGKLISKAVIRGVQLSTGIILMAKGVRLMMGTTAYQQMLSTAEPYLRIQSIGPVPIGLVIGTAAAAVTLFLVENKKFPGGLVAVMVGLIIGVFFGTYEGFAGFTIKAYLPQLLPYGLPSKIDYTFVLLALVLPQIPMTLGNAVIAYSDLSKDYFPLQKRRVSYRSACISMGLANLGAFCLGGMPMCHGAGGLAAHYRFGARTAGSNLMIGALFVALALFLGPFAVAVANLMPMSVLGVLLVFAGSELALTLVDISERRQLFVVLLMAGITLASNLAAAFVIGVLISHALKWERLKI
jgi:SulP family sulfate permease